MKRRKWGGKRRDWVRLEWEKLSGKEGIGGFGWAEKLIVKRGIWFGWDAKDEVEKGEA